VVAAAIGTDRVEQRVHLHFDDKTNDEFLAELAETHPEAIWSDDWVHLNFQGRDRGHKRAFAAALKRARSAQIAAGKVPASVGQSSLC